MSSYGIRLPSKMEYVSYAEIFKMSFCCFPIFNSKNVTRSENQKVIAAVSVNLDHGIYQSTSILTPATEQNPKPRTINNWELGTSPSVTH